MKWSVVCGGIPYCLLLIPVSLSSSASSSKGKEDPMAAAFLVFSGGTAFNACAEALSSRTSRVSYCIPISDNGTCELCVQRAIIFLFLLPYGFAQGAPQLKSHGCLVVQPSETSAPVFCVSPRPRLPTSL